jgi:hypothetical protein
VKEKAFEIATVAKEPLTSHPHHVKMQNRYNTNLQALMTSPTLRAKMIRDAKCTRFSIPNRHLQPIITTVKNAKVENFHINGDDFMIPKQKK